MNHQLKEGGRMSQANISLRLRLTAHNSLRPQTVVSGATTAQPRKLLSSMKSVVDSNIYMYNKLDV